MQAESDLTLGQGRLKERSPIAVIDIGSNSVRQVVYEGLTRAPSVLFNEKVLAGLGKGMVSSGKLDEVAVERALNAIKRFIALGKQLKVSRTHVIATAAARDAKNGPQFIAQVEALTGLKVEVLTGAKEAKYSALGVKSGFYKPNGIVGDMGGGSLELVGINGKIKKGITLPLGGIRLAEAAEGSQQTAIKIANKALKQAEVVWPSKQKTFYAIGGTWRSLGHLHIAHTNYTLSSVHEYQISANEMIEFCEYIIQKGVADISGINAVSKNRRDLLPMGAIVMHATLKSLKADTVAFSSLGVREGVMHALLSKSEQKKDALLDAALDLSTLRSRTPKHCLELSDWTTNAFKVIGIKESAEEKRFRTASCYLTDIAWRAHSD
ncbi:MAG: exopolyphosphatase, partial [Nitratireductor sp.]